MAKIKVKYTDLNGDAPVITQYGIDFISGHAVEFDTADLLPNAPLILHKWRNNPFFEVKGGEEIVHVPPPVKQVDPRELDPEEVEHARLVEADRAKYKEQAAQLAKNAEAMTTKRHYTPRK